MGIGTMARGEKAMLFVTKHYLTCSPFMPDIESFEEVQFEVELVHFIQVCLVCHCLIRVVLWVYIMLLLVLEFLCC